METLEQLLIDYKRYTKIHGQATLEGDFKQTGQSMLQIQATAGKILNHTEGGQRLLSLLTPNEAPGTQAWAATHCLMIDESQAVAMLRSIAKGSDLVSFSASVVLQEWEKGTLDISVLSPKPIATD